MFDAGEKILQFFLEASGDVVTAYGRKFLQKFSLSGGEPGRDVYGHFDQLAPAVVASELRNALSLQMKYPPGRGAGRYFQFCCPFQGGDFDLRSKGRLRE